MQFFRSRNMMCVIWFVLSALLDPVFSKSYVKYSSNVTLEIWCDHGGSLDPLVLGEKTINTSPEEVLFYDCRAPAVSIAAVLSEHNISVPRSLVIVNNNFVNDILDTVDFLQPKLFSGLENLHSLTIKSGVLSASVSEGVIETLHSLQSLHLSRVGLPRVFNSNITELTLEDTRLSQTINCNYKLRVLSLEFVDIDWSSGKPPLLQHCGSLQELKLHYNKYADQFYLSSKGMRILRHAFSGLNKLKKLELLDYELIEIKFQDILEFTKSLNIEIDLRENRSQFVYYEEEDPLQFIHFEEEDYTRLAKRINAEGMNMTLLVDTLLDCDCQNGWLGKAVREFPSFVVTARCRDGGTSIKLVPRENLECIKIKNDSCYPGCSCRRKWLDNATTVRCEDLTAMPQVPNMREVVANSSHIAALRSEDLPDSLKLLDLSNNTLSWIYAAVADKLFSVPDRQIKLAGNPIACNCDNQPFIKAIQDHATQVLDYDNVTCYNETGISQPVSNINADLLCADSSESYNKSTLHIVLNVVFAVLTILAIFITLYHRFKRSIQEYLFIRGYCLSCVTQDEDSDSEREMLYDVFVSFCHKDEEFVVDELLPGLESDPTQPYRACVHYRDWLAGGFIPEQIARSVERSKRTLVVLSRNFVQSMWGLLEFRSAVMCEVRGRRSRLVAVVLDDVAGDPDLDPELRHYVRTNTYVRWGDPLFWQKLRFALPRRTVGASQEVGSSNASRERRCDSNNESRILANFVELELNRVYPNDYTE